MQSGRPRTRIVAYNLVTQLIALFVWSHNDSKGALFLAPDGDWEWPNFWVLDFDGEMANQLCRVIAWIFLLSFLITKKNHPSSKTSHRRFDWLDPRPSSTFAPPLLLTPFCWPFYSKGCNESKGPWLWHQRAGGEGGRIVKCSASMRWFLLHMAAHCFAVDAFDPLSVPEFCHARGLWFSNFSIIGFRPHYILHFWKIRTLFRKIEEENTDG